MVSNLDFYKLFENVKENGCDHNCNACDLHLRYKNVCLIDDEKNWELWNKQEKERFSKILKGGAV